MTSKSSTALKPAAPEQPVISLVAAMAEHRVIGRDNQMPWHLPADLAHFKRVTLGKPVIMGRRTFESIGRPLPGRLNIVLTQRRDWQPEGVSVVHTPQQALACAAEAGYREEVMVIGGGQIYQMFLPMASRLYLTHIALHVDGDTLFPDYTAVAQWQEVSREERERDERNPHDCAFVMLERVTPR